MRRFHNREEAGRLLATRLANYRGIDDLIVLALPRGGVPVASEIAQALAAPLDLCIVRKLGLPGQEELAFGAIASGGARVLNEEIVEAAGLTTDDIDRVTAQEAAELARRDRLYRGDRPPLDPGGKTIILVDDGLATGATMRAAIASLLGAHPRRIIVALPVAARDADLDSGRTDSPVGEDIVGEGIVRTVILLTPPDFQSVGRWYDDFSTVEDDEVIRLLARHQCQR